MRRLTSVGLVVLLAAGCTPADSEQLPSVPPPGEGDRIVQLNPGVGAVEFLDLNEIPGSLTELGSFQWPNLRGALVRFTMASGDGPMDCVAIAVIDELGISGGSATGCRPPNQTTRFLWFMFNSTGIPSVFVIHGPPDVNRYLVDWGDGDTVEGIARRGAAVVDGDSEDPPVAVTAILADGTQVDALSP